MGILVLPEEKQVEKADPDRGYYGFCSMEFLAFVQGACLVQGVIWAVISAMTAPGLLRGSGLEEAKKHKPIT